MWQQVQPSQVGTMAAEATSAASLCKIDQMLFTACGNYLLTFRDINDDNFRCCYRKYLK